MPNQKRRFTISVSQELAGEITAARETGCIGKTQEETLRALIARGLQAWKQQAGGRARAL